MESVSYSTTYSDLVFRSMPYYEYYTGVAAPTTTPPTLLELATRLLRSSSTRERGVEGYSR